jgi:hypothetical protein
MIWISIALFYLAVQYGLFITADLKWERMCR